MDERAWPASRLEELVFKRAVSGKIDIIISQARILSRSLLFLFLFFRLEIVLSTFVERQKRQNAF